MLVDSHCHIPMLDLARFEHGVDSVLDEARRHGVERFLCVCVDLDSYPAVARLAADYECIDSSVGVHPNTALPRPVTEQELVAKAGDAGVVAIGETGLDYFRAKDEALPEQRERFRTHIRAARAVNKPLIIHSRAAKDDVIAILKEENAHEVGGVMHCFVDDYDTALKAIDLGFYISFSGIVTFKNAQALQAVAERLPLEHMLVETDCPYLAPVPYRGKENQPAYTRLVAAYLATLKGLDLARVEAVTTANYFRLFNRI